MSGSGVEKRRRADAVRAAKLRRDGMPYGQIAELTGIPRHMIRDRVLLGERLIDAEARHDNQ